MHVSLIMCCVPGAHLLSGGLQAVRLVPDTGAVWLLLRLQSGGAAAYTGQEEEVHTQNTHLLACRVCVCVEGVCVVHLVSR